MFVGKGNLHSEAPTGFLIYVGCNKWWFWQVCYIKGWFVCFVAVYTECSGKMGNISTECHPGKSNSGVSCENLVEHSTFSST